MRSWQSPRTESLPAGAGRLFFYVGITMPSKRVDHLPLATRNQEEEGG